MSGLESAAELVAPESFTRGPQIEPLATRLRWRQEWERAYLAQRSASLDTRTFAPTSSPPSAPGVAEPAGRLAVPEADRPEMTDDNPRRFGAPPRPSQGPLQGPSQGDVARTMTGTARGEGPALMGATDSRAQAAALRAESATAAALPRGPVAAGQPFEEQLLRVVSHDEGVTLHIRDSALSAEAGMKVLGRLRSLIARSGAHLVEVRLNGVRLWNLPMGVTPRSEEQGQSLDAFY